METTEKKLSPKELAFTAMMAAMLAVCSWISIPVLQIPVTLQTLGVAFALILLGGRNGLIAICVFLALGAAGAPVFSGFKGGLSVLGGPTGGYLVGFVFMGLVYILVTHKRENNKVWQAVGLAAGLLVCYAFGTGWFMVVSTAAGNSRSIGAVLMLCVVPFLLPDGVKLAGAVIIGNAVKKRLGQQP
ncbi:MAG: biotin transporter BioY [Oscillospiraceae bacterium]|nr:biotin transporter BioY [Oscillospiraceae bacterium]